MLLILMAMPDFALNCVYDLYSLSAETLTISYSKLTLGSQYILEILGRLDEIEERVISTILLRWKLLLLIFTLFYCVFRLLQKTSKFAMLSYRFVTQCCRCVTPIRFRLQVPPAVPGCVRGG